MDSEPKFAVFNSTGNLLQGGLEFDAPEYSEIAKRCDRAECSLYCRVGSAGILTLARRYLVRAAGGREERVSAIAEFNGGDTLGAFQAFDEGAQRAVESLEDRNYRVIGVWEEGDIPVHTILRTASAPSRGSRTPSFQVASVCPSGELIPDDLVSLCAGKIIANEMVTIRLPKIGDSLALIRDVSSALRTGCGLKISFSCALAKYHPETDLWVNLSEAGQQGGNGSGDDIHGRGYYQALYCYLRSRASIATTDREICAQGAKTKFFESAGASRIIGFFPSGQDSLFRLYLHNPETLGRLLQAFVDRPLNLSGETSLAVIKALASGGRRSASKSDWLYPTDPVYMYAPVLIKGLSGETKYQARKTLIEKGYFIEPLVEELVRDTLKSGTEKNIDLLSWMTFNNKDEVEFFTAVIDRMAQTLSFAEAVERMKAFLRWNGKRNEAMKKVYVALYVQATSNGDLYRSLTRAEREKTQFWTGKAVRKRPSYRRFSVVPTLMLVLVVLLIVIVIALVLVFFVLPLVGIDITGDVFQVFAPVSETVSGAAEEASEAPTPTGLPHLTETGGE